MKNGSQLQAVKELDLHSTDYRHKRIFRRVRKITKGQYYLRHVRLSVHSAFHSSVRMNNLATTGGVFTKFNI